MKANFAMLALFHTERPLQYVIERDGANQAFVDLSKNAPDLKKSNPHESGTPDWFMFRYGYNQYVQFHEGIKKTLAEQKTTHQRKNAFGGVVYAS